MGRLNLCRAKRIAKGNAKALLLRVEQICPMRPVFGMAVHWQVHRTGLESSESGSKTGVSALGTKRGTSA